MSFLSEPESQQSEDESHPSLVVEDDETTLLNDFLSSAIIDHHHASTAQGYGLQSWNGIDGQQLVAPSSPPPPLFPDESPDLDLIFRY